MRWERSIGGVACVGALLFAGAAHADGQTDAKPDALRFHLAYDAPPGCPDRTAFVEAVRAQTPRAELAGEGQSAISFTVRIDVSQNRTRADLDVRDPDGSLDRRSVSSLTCSEGVKALALVAAVILDPETQTGAVSPPAPPEGFTPATPPAVVPPLSSSAPTSPAPPRGAPSHRAASPPTLTRDQRAWTLSAGVETGVLGGVGPSLAPIGGVLLDGELTARGTRFPAVVFTPALRISANVAATSSEHLVGTQRYAWYGGSLRVCPLHVPLPAHVRVAPCGAFLIGAHRGSAEDVQAPSSGFRLRLAPVIGGTLEWAVSRAVTLELGGGALFPLRRSRFYLAPNVTIFEVPAATGVATLALRVRFF